MIKAQYAKDELIQSNFFRDVIPEDYAYLKQLCEFDFTIEPQKWKNEETKDFAEEYLNWYSALNTLCDMRMNIFDIRYQILINSLRKGLIGRKKNFLYGSSIRT